jgi:hypothetical protein
MTAVWRQLAWLLAVVSWAGAQSTPATLRDVKVSATAKGVVVDISVSDNVRPAVLTASHPERLILDFPNTTSSPQQRRIEVNANGIRAVRYGLNSSQPAITRVVVDLDSVHLYDVRHNGTTVSLKVDRADDSQAVHRVPPAAASGGIRDLFRRRGPSPQAQDSEADLKRPIPGGTSVPRPIANATGAMNPVPTSSHPNRGSLQEGTVFPGLGTPGTGNVPTGRGAPVTSAGANTPPAPSSSASATVTPDPAPKADAPTSVAQVNPSAPVTSTPVLPTTEPAPAPTPGPVTAEPTAVITAALAPSNPLPLTPPAAPAVSKAPPDQTAPAVQDPASALATIPAQPVPSEPTPSVVPTTEPAPVKASVDPKDIAPAPPQTDAGQSEMASVTLPASLPGASGQAGNDIPAPSSTSGEQTEAMLSAPDPTLKTVFRVKYVADGVAYLDGGRSAGLAEGMKLEIKDTTHAVTQGTAVDPADPRVVAELEVSGLAETSSVTDIHAPTRPVKVGDLAYLSNADAQALIAQRTVSPTRQYPIVVAFSEDDPLDEEVRKEVPRPPQPSVNRARGRVGFDYMGTVTHDNPGTTNSDIGMVMRADFTRIAGTYWNLTGYWRGRLHSQSATTTQPTLQDLINRTYHLGMYYDSPESSLVAGFGRLYLPWAPSLDTIDGGYFGVKVRPGTTAGIFAGSTPDPASWNYNPDQRIAGTFINFTGGDYDGVHYTSTSGLGVSALKWQINRPFAFFENTLSYKRYLSIYDSLQADSPRGNTQAPAPGPGLSRNFLTVRVQVHPRVELDFNHNYLRDVPTFDPALVGTSLLDKYLFQGISVGARIEVLKQVFLYSSVGNSNRSGDAKHSLNQLYGLTFNRLPWWGLRADAHYSRFSSSFADGSYRSISLGRNVTDDLRFDILVGDQNYTSSVTSSDRTRFVNTNAEFSIGPRYFMQGGFTVNRGQSQNYDQWLFTLGYRFDSKARRK